MSDDPTHTDPTHDGARQASVPSPDHAPGETGAAAVTPGTSYADTISEDQVKLALRKVKDPELSLNIVDLGLIYGIRVDGSDVAVDMTLTSPGCPAGPQIMNDAERTLKAMPGIGEVTINLVWAPFWTPDRIEPRVRAYMGL